MGALRRRVRRRVRYWRNTGVWGWITGLGVLLVATGVAILVGVAFASTP